MPAALPLASRAKLNIVLAVLTAMFLGALDSTIVAPALPTIGSSVGGAAFLPWIVSAYFLTSTAVTPLFGKWSDIEGRRIAMLSALGLFLIGSVACALSPNIGVLIFSRALQGVGGGGLMAMAQTVLADIASPRERAQYTVYISTVWALASLGGPALGGFLSQHLSWTLIFWLNLPVGSFAFWLCDKLLRDLPQQRRPHRLDWLGGLLVVGATAALMLTLTLGGNFEPWRSPRVFGLGVAALALAVALVAHLRRAPEPLIPLTLFANRVVDKAALAMFFAMLVYISSIVYLPIYLQTCLRLDPTASGLALILVLGAGVVGSNFTGLNLPRLRRYKTMSYIGLPAAAAALAGLAALAPSLGFWGAEGFVLVFGLGLGTIFPTLTVAVQNAVDPRDMGAGTATLGFVRSLGSAIGVAVFGAVLYGFGLDTSGGAAVPAAAAVAFRACFGAMALAVLVSFAFFAAMEERPLRGPAAASAPEPDLP